MAPKKSLILRNKLRAFIPIDPGSNGPNREKTQNLSS